MEAAFFTKTGEAKGKVELPSALFEGKGTRYVLHEVVIALQGNQRRGTSATKTRGLVSGGGRKPWKQKGTGNARSGSIRSPLWRKGGIIFGPSPRSYRVDVPVAKKWQALCTALTELAKAEKIGVIDALVSPKGKTSEIREILNKTGLSGKITVVVDKRDDLVSRAARNIAQLQIADASELNAWESLAASRLLFTKAGLEALEKRIPKG